MMTQTWFSRIAIRKSGRMSWEVQYVIPDTREECVMLHLIEERGRSMHFADCSTILAPFIHRILEDKFCFLPSDQGWLFKIEV